MRFLGIVLTTVMLGGLILSGCSGDSSGSSGKVEIEIIQYKQEAATYFDEVEERFQCDS